LGGAKAGDGKEAAGLVHKTVALNHVVFRCDSQSKSRMSDSASNAAATGKRKERPAVCSLFGRAVKSGQ
jgi:hypothetical protein